MINENTDAWVCLNDVCGYLGINPMTAKRLHKEQGLPLYKIGREWRAKLSEIDDWIRGGETA